MSVRSSVGFRTNLTTDESGWASNVPNVQAEIMNRPRPSPSETYSGQCPTSVAVHGYTRGAALLEMNMLPDLFVRVLTCADGCRQLAPSGRRHSGSQPGRDSKRHTRDTCRTQTQRSPIFLVDPGKSGYPKPS